MAPAGADVVALRGSRRSVSRTARGSQEPPALLGGQRARQPALRDLNQRVDWHHVQVHPWFHRHHRRQVAPVVAGQQLGHALLALSLGSQVAAVEVVGQQLRDTAMDAFAGVGLPLAHFGADVEQFIVAVAAAIALILALLTIGPWLNRYLPWRWSRVRRMRAAHRAIRTIPDAGDPAIARALAMRAVSRLDCSTLLENTPDPLGDWASGRHDRLARAELASVGLRP